MHNFIVALATQAHPQKPQGCPFAYINIADGCVHCRSLPCFHGKSQMNYLVAKENTSTLLYFSSYMTFFFFFSLVPPSFISLLLFLPLTTLFQTPFPNHSISDLFSMLLFYSSHGQLGKVILVQIILLFPRYPSGQRSATVQAPSSCPTQLGSSMDTCPCNPAVFHISVARKLLQHSTHHQGLQPNLATGCCLKARPWSHFGCQSLTLCPSQVLASIATP